ncbi:unnamed protein product [Aphanomyces euteiches]|uniref:BZIP domain-containing protein n=1 Tax=Aphanomyces euteiches TaxID=100861 RepID=A0A6G0WBE8_9STRA|nr:hypothetical protein Ae201684_016778 [Aphanomyces euteiches]
MTEVISHHRQSNKERARENRRLRREEFIYLRNRVAELSRQLHSQTKMLPWEEVALALKTDTSTAHETNRTLRRDIKKAKDLLEFLVMTVCNTMSRLPQASSLVQGSGWADHNLLGVEGEARTASYRWLLDRLFHNTDLAYAQCPNTPSALIDVNFDGHFVTSTIRSHYIIPAPMDQAARTIQSLYKWDFFVGSHLPIRSYDSELLQESFGPNTFHVDYQVKSTILESCRVSPTRIVFSRCNVNFDAANPHLERQNVCVHEWRILEPMSAFTCRLVYFRLVTFPLTITNEECAFFMGENVHTVNQWTDTERLDEILKNRYKFYSFREQSYVDSFYTWLPHFVQPNEDFWRNFSPDEVPTDAT